MAHCKKKIIETFMLWDPPKLIKLILCHPSPSKNHIFNFFYLATKYHITVFVLHLHILHGHIKPQVYLFYTYTILHYIKQIYMSLHFTHFMFFICTYTNVDEYWTLTRSLNKFHYGIYTT
jgi:hypothetical protein